jgi:lipopolysaccharide/colanic/teichoic acid biosynthesis glycosyltransferase
MVGLVLLSPLFAAIAAVVKAQDGGPIFYRATRTGRYGRPFRLYKFRTMITGADKVGPAITAGGDARVTRAGRWLRRTKLDELPQLINVLAGDMSLVGPRPEDPRYVSLYTPEQREILQVRPGITSAASLTYRREEQMLAGADWELTYRNQVMPAKLEIDLAYLANRDFWSDLMLIIRTATALFK